MQWVWNRRSRSEEPRAAAKAVLTSSYFDPGVAIWGDSFCDDEMIESLNVFDLQSCAPAEYIRVFPGVLPTSASSLRVLERHVARCAAVRAWRLRNAPTSPCLRATKASDVASVGPKEHSAWFAEADLPSPDQLNGELLLLNFADDISWRIQNQAIGLYHEPTASLFAFATGVHPVYLWNEALVSVELHAAAGWLGVLNRGYRAYMPADIAEYFLDVIVADSRGRVSIRDCRIASLLKDESTIDHIRRVALKRRKGAGVATGRLPRFCAPRVDVSSWPDAGSWMRPLGAVSADGG